MNYLMIDTGLCVQPTMEKPIRHDDEMGLGWAERDSDWNAHIASLPKLDTTCTLPAGEWFEGAIRYERSIMRMPVNDERWWTLCTKAEYEERSPALSYREVIVPVGQKIEYCEGENDIAFNFHKANDVEQKDEPKDDILNVADYAADNLPSSIKESNDPVTKLAFITGFVKGFKYAKPKVEPQPAPKEGSEFVKLLDKYGCGLEMFTENELSMISGAVRELMDRIWDAGVKWEWIEHLNQEREEEGSPRGINPCPDKETFISSLF